MGKLGKLTISLGALGILSFASVAFANHTWGNYHWARTANPFTLKIGDNVSSQWDTVLRNASNDWSQSVVLDTTVVSGRSSRSCNPTLGRVEVCNNRYGNNGWLGVASIWVVGDHISEGTVKLNDTYFNTATYNTTAWKNLVTCQEIGHTFGLSHQDEDFYNANLGTCMDYTANPTSNQHPNTHDYDELALIYAHLDTTTSVGQSTSNGIGSDIGDLKKDWGKAIKKDSKGNDNVFEKDLGDGNKVITHVFWAE